MKSCTLPDNNSIETHSKHKILILCDFDGTISTKDTVNRLVREHLSAPEWRFHVKRYMRGEIGSREVYKAVAPLMRMSQSDLNEFVNRHAALDPYFIDFLQWARNRGIDLKVLSDGFDATIRTLFRNHGIGGLGIFANRLIFLEDGKVSIESPYSNDVCGKCGTCKLDILLKFRGEYDKIMLIGDGESDRHAAGQADMVVALKDLFLYCARMGIPALRAEGFREIPHLLTRRVEAVAFDMDGTLLDSLDAIAEAFNHMFSRLGYPSMTVEEVARKTSISLIDFVKSFLRPDEVQPGIKIFRDYYDTIFLEKTSLVPGAVDTLKALNGNVSKGIVTNKRGRYARILADHFGLAGNMERIIGAEDGFKAKPSGEMFEEFMQSVGVARDKTIYVGDAPLDIQAAENAGIDAFAVASPIFSAEELALCRPRRVLRNITELTTALGPFV
ncbi:MAG: HAD-IB family phosphatase [Desulfomonile sp.]